MAKNILADFDYERHAALIDWALESDVHLVHTRDPYGHKGGFSFAWRRCSEFAKGRMVEVAVTFCSPRDTFCRKIGAINALALFEEGNTICVPVGDEDAATIVERLRWMFNVAYFSGK